MATLVIKNVPDALHATLKRLAREHRRSLAQETLTLLETAIAGGATPPKKPLPKPVRLSSGALTIDEIEAMVMGGRD